MHRWEEALEYYPNIKQLGLTVSDYNCTWYVNADMLEALLAKAPVVIGSPETDWNEIGNKVETHKALLINIQPIEKCKHPVEKVKRKEHYYEHGFVMGPKETTHFGTSYECDCGKDVTPATFQEK